MLKVPVAVLLKIPRGVSRSFVLRCCWRFLQGFAEGSYRGLPKVPTLVLLKVPTAVLKVQVFWDTAVRHRVRHFEGSRRLLTRDLKAIWSFETSESINPTTAEYLGWSKSSVKYLVKLVHAWCEMPIRPVFYVHYCAVRSITRGEDQYFLVLAVSVASKRLAEFVSLCYVLVATTPSG
jgi:hypothetical protein